MLPLVVLVAGLVVGAGQQVPVAPVPAPTAFPCDAAGEISCAFQETETVTGSRSLQDLRIISQFIQLVSERNRRYYIAWETKAPSAAFELVKRVKAFPYLPYGDTYSIVGVNITLNQQLDRVRVRYPRKPKQNAAQHLTEKDFVSYETKLSDFIKRLEADILKLKKYEKTPGAPF